MSERKEPKKWVCVDSIGYESELAQGKAYEEISSRSHLLGVDFADPFCIVIKNELGIVSEYYQPLRFQEIGEWRQSQLGKLGI